VLLVHQPSHSNTAISMCVCTRMRKKTEFGFHATVPAHGRTLVPQCALVQEAYSSVPPEDDLDDDASKKTASL